MFTRVEIDGFKSFQSLSLELRPFCVIVGPNAAGKSNFFDALRLLATLADTDARSALQDLRGEPHELFRQMPDGQHARHMRLAVEVLLDRDFIDPYGERHYLKNTRVRYEVGLERRADSTGSLERILVDHESAHLIQREQDQWLKKHPAQETIKKWALAKKSTTKLISMSEGGRVIEVTQDGSAGRKRTLPMGEASATFLSSLRTGSEFKHLFALRKELTALRFLQLNPEAERSPSDVLANDELDPNGANLPTVLARIKAETATKDRPSGLLADIRGDLAGLIPGVTGLEVERNEAAKQFQLFVEMRDQGRLSSRVLSDGTLRVLALLTLLHDPRRRGALCFEEPENGVHEARIPGLVETLRDFCTDFSQEPERDETLSQIIVNTHSPVVMANLLSDEIIVADTVLTAEAASGTRTRRTRMRSGISEELPLSGPEDREHRLSRSEVERLLRRETEQV